MPLPPIPLFTIQIELEGMGAAFGGAGEKEVRDALEAGAFLGAQFLQGLWLKVAQSMNVRGGSGSEQSYVSGIESAEITKVSTGGSGTAESSMLEVVFELRNTSPHADLVENGHDAFHLPSAMSWNSPRVKQGKNGPYLHVAFRHAAFVDTAQRGPSGMTLQARRAMMPDEVYQQAKRLMYRQPLRQGPIIAGGQFVAADRYTWSATNGPKRIRRGDVQPDVYKMDAGGQGELFLERRGPRTVENRAGKVVGTNPSWKSSKYEGLFKSGTKGHASYMTIRTITPRSAGWNIPAVPGKHIAARVAAFAQNDPGLHEVVLSGVRGLLGGAR